MKDLPDDLFDLAVSDEEREAATQALRLFAPPRERKRKSRTLPDSEWRPAHAHATELMTSGDWGNATPKDFVASYAVLHTDVYGVEPSELTSKTRFVACMCVAALLSKEFHDDKSLFAEYIRWVWEREESREKWRRENKHPGGRIAWQAMFMTSSLLSDWRLDHVRRGQP